MKAKKQTKQSRQTAARKARQKDAYARFIKWHAKRNGYSPVSYPAFSRVPKPLQTKIMEKFG